jgi:26S proteasome regulatory subunit, ATPase 3, interacting protein
MVYYALVIDMILEYLRQQNRPYSASNCLICLIDKDYIDFIDDIVSNLHQAVSKIVTQKVLDQLVAEGEVTEKAYGKQTVYVIRQDSTSAPSQEELDSMDDQINKLKNVLSEQKEQWKTLSTGKGR